MVGVGRSCNHKFTGSPGQPTYFIPKATILRTPRGRFISSHDFLSSPKFHNATETTGADHFLQWEPLFAELSRQLRLPKANTYFTQKPLLSRLPKANYIFTLKVTTYWTPQGKPPISHRSHNFLSSSGSSFRTMYSGWNHNFLRAWNTTEADHKISSWKPHFLIPQGRGCTEASHMFPWVVLSPGHFLPQYSEWTEAGHDFRTKDWLPSGHFWALGHEHGWGAFWTAAGLISQGNLSPQGEPPFFTLGHKFQYPLRQRFAPGRTTFLHLQSLILIFPRAACRTRGATFLYSKLDFSIFPEAAILSGSQQACAWWSN